MPLRATPKASKHADEPASRGGMRHRGRPERPYARVRRVSAAAPGKRCRAQNPRKVLLIDLPGFDETEIPGHENTQPAPPGRWLPLTGRPGHGPPLFPRRRDPALSLDLDGGACFLELLLDALRFVLRHTFLDGSRLAPDEILRFLQTEARHGANDLDARDLVVSEGIHDNIELGLFLGGRRGLGRRARGRGNGNRRRSGHAPLLLEGLNEFDHFHDRFVAQRLDQFFVRKSHFLSPDLQIKVLPNFLHHAACSLRAFSTRASIAPGSATVRTSFEYGACRTPSSIDRASSSVGRDATRSSSLAS